MLGAIFSKAAFDICHLLFVHVDFDDVFTVNIYTFNGLRKAVQLLCGGN